MIFILKLWIWQDMQLTSIIWDKIIINILHSLWYLNALFNVIFGIILLFNFLDTIVFILLFLFLFRFHVFIYFFEFINAYRAGDYKIEIALVESAFLFTYLFRIHDLEGRFWLIINFQSLIASWFLHVLEIFEIFELFRTNNKFNILLDMHAVTFMI